jgi:hypothetical protein
MPNRDNIMTKAAEDPQFRQKLKSDPRGTLQRETGTPIPSDVEITVLEETRDHAYIVLPRLRSEMTQEELAGAAGGAGVGCTNYVWTVYCTA